MNYFACAAFWFFYWGVCVLCTGGDRKNLLGLVFKNALGLTGYRAAFFYFLVLGEGLGLFDLVVIDLLWWRNTKRIRFSFLPEKAPYQDSKEHIASFLRGIPLFAAVAAISAGIVTLL